MMLGDPKTSDQWGRDDTWGVAKFTHQNHTEKYKISCANCHHTNGKENAALNEDVQRCVDCHKAEGDEKNPTNADGDELDVKNSFHLGETGCINCHKREQAKNPNSTAQTTCAGCHQPKSAGGDRLLKGLSGDDAPFVAVGIRDASESWTRLRWRSAGLGDALRGVLPRLWYVRFAPSAVAGSQPGNGPNSWRLDIAGHRRLPAEGQMGIPSSGPIPGAIARLSVRKASGSLATLTRPAGPIQRI
jgi:hypothetical protein